MFSNNVLMRRILLFSLNPQMTHHKNTWVKIFKAIATLEHLLHLIDCTPGAVNSALSACEHFPQFHSSDLVLYNT